MLNIKGGTHLRCIAIQKYLGVGDTEEIHDVHSSTQDKIEATLSVSPPPSEGEPTNCNTATALSTPTPSPTPSFSEALHNVNSFIADKEASDAFVAASTILLRDAAPEHLKNGSIDGDAAISVGPGKDYPPLRSEDVYYWQSFSRGICV